MAGTLTHQKIGEDIYKKIAKNVNKDIYLLSCQGHDLLYFIKLRQIFKFKKYGKIAKRLQNKYFNDLVIELQKLILDNDGNVELKSFLYGYITHHITDSIIHPFIHYHSGYYKSKQKETKKYKGAHSLLESVIDAKLTDNVHECYKKFPKVSLTDDLTKQVDQVFYKVYHEKNIGRTLVKNMKNVRGFLKTYRIDKSGVKRIAYLCFDFITRKKVAFLSYHYPSLYLDFSLSEKRTWHHPVTNQEYVSSFNDLYNECVKEVTKIINTIEKCLKQKKIAEIDLNISAVHGLECNKNYELKYFLDYPVIF